MTRYIWTISPELRADLDACEAAHAATNRDPSDAAADRAWIAALDRIRDLHIHELIHCAAAVALCNDDERKAKK